MHFSVDPAGPMPPSEQLADQVRFAVASGRLAAGEKLPSLRGLAAEVRVNPNTVGRAWRELEREGVLEARRGDGMYVAAEAQAACREAVSNTLAERIGRAVAEARAAGLSAVDVLELVETGLAAWQQTFERNEQDSQTESKS
ncbi:MAG: GntR family transcriptional regulator [Planctomycetota bacterium]|jgi:GntR family transcriptional regulator